MVRDEIRQALDEMKVVDTHEHLTLCAGHLHEKMESLIDLPYFLTRVYLAGDFVAAGLDAEEVAEERFGYLKDPALRDDSEALWDALKPFLTDVRTTDEHSVPELVSFYMGKNTRERRSYIMDNLVMDS